MSSERQPPDDRELEAFLDGEHPASKAYASTRREPPTHLDATVLQLARAAAAPRSRSALRRWRAPLAAAAVLVLAVGVILRLPERAPPPGATTFAEPQVQREVMAEAETAAVTQPAPATEPAPPPVTAVRKPAPPAAAKKREAPEASAPSAPAMSAAPPPPPMASVPAPVQAAADAAGAVAMAEENAAKDEALASRAERRAFVAAEMTAQSQRKQKAAAAPAPMFDGLLVGSVDRAAVHARYGEPPKPAASAPEALQSRDRYEQLAGHAGSVEFVYDEASQRLLTVIESLPPGTTANALSEQHSGAAPTLISERAPAQCVVAEAWPEAQYYLFAERRLYWIVDRSGDVRRIIYDSGCADFD